MHESVNLDTYSFELLLPVLALICFTGLCSTVRPWHLLFGLPLHVTVLSLRMATALGW